MAHRKTPTIVSRSWTPKAESGAMSMSAGGLEMPDEARQILVTARSSERPRDWFVWPLRRDVVARGLAGWAATGVLGFLLFVPAMLVTVPSNFQHGAWTAVFTITLLVILGLVAFGGAGLFFADVLRLMQSDKYLLVITPDDYVQATPRRIVHVPMASVAYVTLKGVKPPPSPDAERAFAQAMLTMRRYGSVMGIP